MEWKFDEKQLEEAVKLYASRVASRSDSEYPRAVEEITKRELKTFFESPEAAPLKLR